MRKIRFCREIFGGSHASEPMTQPGDAPQPVRWRGPESNWPCPAVALRSTTENRGVTANPEVRGVHPRRGRSPRHLPSEAPRVTYFRPQKACGRASPFRLPSRGTFSRLRGRTVRSTRRFRLPCQAGWAGDLGLDSNRRAHEFPGVVLAVRCGDVRRRHRLPRTALGRQSSPPGDGKSSPTKINPYHALT
jgi:hypothetical protein